MLTPAWHFLRNLFRRDRVELELDRELEAYLELLTSENVAEGMSPEQARRSALLKLGGREQVKEQVREVRLGAWVEGVARDARYGVRMLARSPGLTAVIVLSLALGIGATSAVFSWGDTILLRPLPVPDPAAVVTVGAEATGDASFGSGRMSYPNYRDLREQASSFDGLVAYDRTKLSFARARGELREMRMGVLVSDNYFQVLGVEPTIGRGFAPDEGKAPGRDTVVVLAHDFWRNVLGADRSLVGAAVPINGVDFTVIGVTPRDFTGTDGAMRPAFFLPITMAQRLERRPENPLENRSAHGYVNVKGRLAPHASAPSAQAELSALWAGLEQQHPEANRSRSIVVRSEIDHRIRRSPPDAAILSMQFALAALVLLIACANVSTLLLGRARTRAREMALRRSLGAGRARLFRQLLTESVLLALLATILGVGFAYGGVQFFRGFQVPTDLPLVNDTRLDTRALLVCLLLGAASVGFFGLAPAWQSTSAQLASTLKRSDRGSTSRSRFGSALVATQVALSTVLLLTASVLYQGFRQLLVLDPGFRTEGVMMLSTDVSLAGYEASRARRFFRELVERTQSIPGVGSAALASSIPLTFEGFFRRGVVPEGFELAEGQESVSTPAAIVDERYFETLDIEVLRGRVFRRDDDLDSPLVAIVNEEFASRYWPGEDPTGRRLRLANSDSGPLEVVGLVETGKYEIIVESPMPFLYLPMQQHRRSEMTLLVETARDPGALAASLRELVRSLDDELPVFNVRPLSTVYEQRSIGAPRFLIRMVGAFSGLGLTLALIGLYALVAYSVTRRTREIGVRMAVGATSVDVLKLVLRQGFVLAAVGVVVGGVISALGAPLLGAILAGLEPTSVSTYLVTPVALIALSVLASYIPARRASLLDPNRTLRSD